MRFTALLHHVNVDLLRSSYYNLKRDAAAGVDEVTWQEYGDGLEARLVDLHGRIHRGAYHAKPSRRVWIDKADGRKRPLGIAALEDKVVQAAVQVLNQIWEEDFPDFSYGFRPGRGQQGSPLVSGGIRCALRRDHQQEGELCRGLGHSVIFRQSRA
jgi:RNA-directed DNA polymerase